VVRGPPGGANVRNDRYHVLEIKQQQQQQQHTHTHTFNDHFSGTTQVSRYQKGKTNLDFTEARDSQWQWHQLGHVQVCTALQTDNHASTPSLSFLQAGCPSCHTTNSVKSLKTNRNKAAYNSRFALTQSFKT